MSMHRLTAGAGYQYLLRHTASRRGAAGQVRPRRDHMDRRALAPPS